MSYPFFCPQDALFCENEKPCEGTNEVVPSSIQKNEFEGSHISNITVENETFPSTPCRVLTPGECGMPHTPPHCMLVMPSDEALEGGYDSDGNIGPFISADVDRVQGSLRNKSSV